MTTFVRTVFLLAACAAPVAGAQTVYKYTDPKGGTVYTDDPKAASGRAQKLELPAPQNAASAPPATKLSEADRRTLTEGERRAAALDRAVDDIIASSRALREAEERRERGIEPLEGERMGRRFRPEYWQRRQAEEQGVAAARARLDDALARRNALR
jgi:hypothetical protein